MNYDTFKRRYDEHRFENVQSDGHVGRERWMYDMELTGRQAKLIPKESTFSALDSST